MSGQLSPDVQQITAPTYKHAAQIRPGTVLVVASAITGPAWLLVIGLLGPAFKDLWQHRRQYVAGTRWWAPFCCTVDLVAAALIGFAILTGIV